MIKWVGFENQTIAEKWLSRSKEHLNHAWDEISSCEQETENWDWTTREKDGTQGEILAAMIGVEKQPDMFDTRGTSDMWSIRTSLNGGFLSHGGTTILKPSFKWSGHWIMERVLQHVT